MSFQKYKGASTLLLIVLDILILAATDMLALFVRFDFSVQNIPAQYVESWLRYFPLQAALTVIVFGITRMYRYIWRTVNIRDVGQMIFSILLAYALSCGAFALARQKMSHSVWFICLFLQLFVFLAERVSLRVLTVIRNELVLKQKDTRIMLIGAGSAGRMLMQEIARNADIHGRVVCIVDDNKAKWGKYMSGVRIIGGRDEILSAAKEKHISQIIFAIPTASAEEKREILDICKMTGCHLRTVPGIYQLVNGEVTVDAIKDVQVEDLLGREPVKLELGSLRSFLGGKTVLVTGGGGSIGSELCRQIAGYSPGKLIILDIYENNAYEIQQELKETYGTALDLRVEIASVRDSNKIDELFSRYRPDIVFHAAAHKHVPLMEDCPSEAIKNNIFGTYHVVCAAEKYGVSRFVMISTDKAVNPTNVMGATKRFCEMILQSRRDSRTEFCAVRFGNVLGSNGSVVPLFKKQIEKGGPVTITDKRIIRYFMTIPEATQLVLEAGAMAESGQVFVLDMGEPVKILTLAENLIRLSGLEPYRDIDITEIGLRPGEKLYEEMLMKSENLSETQNRKIFVEEQRPIDRQTVQRQLAAFSEALETGADREELVRLLKEYVTTFHDPETVNRDAVIQAS